MKKHVIAAVAAATFVTTAMAGCTGADTTAGGESVNGEPSVLQTEAVMDSTELSGDVAEDDGKVTLTVWAEEANFDVLQEMIDSFEQKYAGQADFDIRLRRMQMLRRAIRCLEMYITERMSSRCRTISLPAWLQPVP